MSDVQQRIDTLVKGHRVVLFMKGTAQFPQCGFSGRAVQILNACGVNDLTTVNVLEDEEIRQGIKGYANWPTIPQLYVNRDVPGGRIAAAARVLSGSRPWANLPAPALRRRNRE
jgi:monothiol glutaredoxin